MRSSGFISYAFGLGLQLISEEGRMLAGSEQIFLERQTAVIKLEAEIVGAAGGNAQHYGMAEPLFLQRPYAGGACLETGENQICRFCGRSRPEVSFRHGAHARPESLGNKSLFTIYECDSGNQFFGGLIAG